MVCVTRRAGGRPLASASRERARDVAPDGYEVPAGDGAGPAGIGTTRARCGGRCASRGATGRIVAGRPTALSPQRPGISVESPRWRYAAGRTTPGMQESPLQKRRTVYGTAAAAVVAFALAARALGTAPPDAGRKRARPAGGPFVAALRSPRAGEGFSWVGERLSARPMAVSQSSPHCQLPEPLVRGSQANLRHRWRRESLQVHCQCGHMWLYCLHGNRDPRAQG